MKKNWKTHASRLAKCGFFSRIAKLFCLALFICCSLETSANLTAQEAKVNVNFKNANFTSVVKELRRQTTCSFIYTAEDIALIQPLTLVLKNAGLEDILDIALEDTGLTYQMTDRTVIIRRNLKVNTPEVQDEKVITGTVSEKANGKAIPGVNIVVKGSKFGTVSDLDGAFELRIKNAEEQTLLFTCIGMEDQEVKIGKQTHLAIQMEENMEVIKDVVVTGAYGTMQKRSDMVGSAFQVTSKNIENLPSTRVDMLLEGLVPGLSIKPNSDGTGNVRGRNNIRVRGNASLSASNEPLWIVDGTPIYTGGRTNMIAGMSTAVSPLSYLNPNDIESISVLKDASATSIYGANGANGIILITTKKGKKGKANVQISARYGVSQINKSTRYKVLNADEYRMLAEEAYINAGKDMTYYPFQDNELNQYSTTNTDWYDVFYEMGNNTEANLSVSGGKDNISYYLTGSYYQLNRAVKGNKQERYSIRSRTEVQLSQKFSLELNLSASYNINDIFNAGDEYYENLPIYSPYDSEGNFQLYNKYVSGADMNGEPIWKRRKFFNSVAEREENDYLQHTYATQTNLLLKYRIIDGLNFTSQTGIDYQSSTEEQYKARTNWSGMSLSGDPIGISQRNYANHITVTNIERINYNKTFNKHIVGGLAGFEIKTKEYKSQYAYGNGFVNDHIKEIAYAVDNKGSSSSQTQHAMSFFGQGSYSYDSRYYLTLNFRKDGDSSFGSDVRWAKFASIGASWNIHNESFFNSSLFSIVKLKASYGSNGNSRLGSQNAMGIYSYDKKYRYMNSPGGGMSSSPNRKLSWETTYMTNLGLRISLRHKIDLEVEYYHNKTVDLLSKLDVSRTTGDTRINRNIGSILNEGIEFTFSSHNIHTDNFEWTTDINASHNSNKLLELYNGNQKIMGTKLYREGYSTDTYYLVRWAGVDPRDGMPMWYDKNGNITRTYSYDNRVPYKSSNPDLEGGISNSFSYKNWHLRVAMVYQIGGYTFTRFGRGINSDGLTIMDENQSVDQLDRWQNSGDLALNPKPIWGVSTKSVMNSSRFLQNATHLRLQNIALTYSFPTNKVKQLGIEGCSVSFIADNIAVFTPYDQKDRNSYRNSMSGYPMETSYSMSLNLSF